MRILVLAPQMFYTDRGSPIDNDILVRALSEEGEMVDLVVYSDGEDRSYPGLEIHRPRAPRWLHGIGPGFSFRKLIADLYLFHVTRKLVRERVYDVVHACEEAVFIAMWLKRRHRLPYVYDMDSSIAQQMIEQIPWLKPLAPAFNWLEAIGIRGATAVAPVCHALTDLAAARGARHILTLYDISQLEEPERRPTGRLREQLELGNAPILMYVGNLEKYQGVDLLIEAFAIAVRRGATAHLVVAGGSDVHIGAYKAKCQALGVADRVHFLGPWPVDRLDELLTESDMLTSPRIKGVNTPMKVFPYLHSGRPVLVTDLPTHTQTLTSDVVMLAPAEPAGFADAILRLSADPVLRMRLGAAGRAFVERDHTYPAHRQRVAMLYGIVRREIGIPNNSDFAPSPDAPRARGAVAR